MLNSVLNGAVFVVVRMVHWLQALTAATIIVSLAPRSRSAAKSTAYDTDIVDPLVASGSLTFRAEASDEQPSKITNRSGFAIECGANIPRTIAPAASTAATNSRAATGRSFIRLRLGGAESSEMIPRFGTDSGLGFTISASGRP